MKISAHLGFNHKLALDPNTYVGFGWKNATKKLADATLYKLTTTGVADPKLVLGLTDDIIKKLPWEDVPLFDRSGRAVLNEAGEQIIGKRLVREGLGKAGEREVRELFISEVGAVEGPPLHPNCRCVVRLMPLARVPARPRGLDSAA